MGHLCRALDDSLSSLRFLEVCFQVGAKGVASLFGDVLPPQVQASGKALGLVHLEFEDIHRKIAIGVAQPLLGCYLHIVVCVLKRVKYGLYVHVLYGVRI